MSCDGTLFRVVWHGTCLLVGYTNISAMKSRFHWLAPPCPMLRVLCIDNDEGLLGFLAELLPKCGHSVVTASNLQDGLKVLAETAVDAVILGAELPEIRLKAAASKIRSRRPRAAVLLYGVGDEASEEMLEVVDGFVNKADIWGLLLLLTVVEAEQSKRRTESARRRVG